MENNYQVKVVKLTNACSYGHVSLLIFLHLFLGKYGFNFLTPIKGYMGIVFTHVICLGRQSMGKSWP